MTYTQHSVKKILNMCGIIIFAVTFVRFGVRRPNPIRSVMVIIIITVNQKNSKL